MGTARTPARDDFPVPTDSAVRTTIMDQRAEASNSMTIEDYLALEEASSVKYEYVGGEVYDLAGALLPHNLIVTNLTSGMAIGDGALGFWSAVREVFPETREQRCWVHYADLRIMPTRCPCGTRLAVKRSA
jgi:hypothetical protein